MLNAVTYDQAMMHSDVVLTLRIDAKQPIEIGDFVGAFTSLAAEYRRQIGQVHPDVDDDANIYVKEIRKGSYEAYLIP